MPACLRGAVTAIQPVTAIATTDDQLLAAYHRALNDHADSQPGSRRRVETFVQLASAEVALLRRFGTAYLLHYCNRYSN
jgi:hypothetical protein